MVCPVLPLEVTKGKPRTLGFGFGFVCGLLVVLLLLLLLHTAALLFARAHGRRGPAALRAAGRSLEPGRAEKGEKV